MKIRVMQFTHDQYKIEKGLVEVIIYVGFEIFFEFVLGGNRTLYEISSRIAVIISGVHSQNKLDITAIGLYEKLNDELFDELLVEIAYEDSDVDDDYRSRIVHVIDTEGRSTYAA